MKAEQLLAAYNKANADGKEDDLGEGDAECSDEEGDKTKEIAGVNMAELETALNLSDETKLFQVVTSSARNRNQVLRYIMPSAKSYEPLWTGKKGKLEAAPPKCEKCGSARVLEVQITPQLFDYCAPLRLVDWDTIVMYTCSNVGGCEINNFFKEEFAFVQFSEDCLKAHIGVPTKKKPLPPVQEEVKKELSAEEQARKAEKNRKKREKQK